ncbi:DUF3027 domain-containing protein [Microbacterium mitrae]|uniref:DUF3027 domain-containing protein n=1 Tax=Microbacterium mitrae TaxID=664640 RepID=A0A5C8HPB0_9MICO|nr:DUF3027 domain-containing protein [Microbacterium mitrae]
MAEAEAEVAAEAVVAPAVVEPDAALLAAHDLAYAALLEITPAATIGAPAGHIVEPDGVVSLMFETTLLGYPGWFWTVSLARVPGDEPTVLEAELLPGERALVAPDWVPWAVRLAEYQAAQVAAAENAAGEASDESDDDLDDEIDDDDLDDDEDLDFDPDDLHSEDDDDLDGVDIDALGEVSLSADIDDDADDDGDDSAGESDDTDDDESDGEPEATTEPAKKRRRLSWRRLRR